MKALTYITDKIIDQQCEMETQGIKPEYVIIGAREADMLMEAEREFPMVAGPATQKSQLLGMIVVVDWECLSRVTVVEGFSHKTWRNRISNSGGEGRP